MSHRAARVVAAAGLVVSVGAALGAFALGVAHDVDGFLEAWSVLVIVFLGFAAMGGLIASRRPAHPIGWLMLAFGGLPLVLSLVQTYARVGLFERPGTLPASRELAWLGEVPWGLVWSLFALVLLLFPSGRPVTRRWRWVVGAAAANAVATVVLSAVALWPARLAVDHAAGIEPVGGLVGGAMGVSFVLVGASVVAGAVSLSVRYRAAGEVERAQLAWLAFASPFIVMVVVLVAARNVFEWTTTVVDQLAIAPVAVVPVAMGVAILRYRLYEIDRIVSRTVTYALLTALLAAVYLAAVLALSRVLPPLAAGGSELAVAGATLAAAAVFTPARRHIQSRVDRRFNRSRYHAEHAVMQLSARLRSEADLDHVTRDLLATVDETLEPAAASVWLYAPGRAAR